MTAIAVPYAGGKGGSSYTIPTEHNWTKKKVILALVMGIHMITPLWLWD